MSDDRLQRQSGILGRRQHVVGGARAHVRSSLVLVVLGFAFDTFGRQSPFWISATLVMATLLLGRDMELYAPRVAKSSPV